MTTLRYMTVAAIATLMGLMPSLARADFWSDDTNRFNERLSDLNRTFEMKARGEIDRASFEKAGLADPAYLTDSTHWPSYLCGGSVLPTLSQSYYTTYYGKPTSVRLGMSKIKLIRCVAGAEKNILVSGETMTVILDKTSGQNDPPMVAAAMLRAFPDSAWDGADDGIKDELAKVNQSCGCTATFSYDKAHINAASYVEHLQSPATACGEILRSFIPACEHNAPIKAKVQKVTTFVCTKGAQRGLRIEPTQVTLSVTDYEAGRPPFEADAEFNKVVPGAAKAWKW